MFWLHFHIVVKNYNYSVKLSTPVLTPMTMYLFLLLLLRESVWPSGKALGW